MIIHERRNKDLLKLNYKFSFLKIDNNRLKTDSFPFPLNLFFYCNNINVTIK